MDWFAPPRNTWIFQRYSIQHSLPVDQRIRLFPQTDLIIHDFMNFHSPPGSRDCSLLRPCGRMRGGGLFEVVDRRKGMNSSLRKPWVVNARSREMERKRKKKKNIYIYCENRVWKGERKGWPSNVWRHYDRPRLALPPLLARMEAAWPGDR